MLNNASCPVCQYHARGNPFAVYDHTHVLFCDECGTGWVIEGRESPTLNHPIGEGSKNYDSFNSEQAKGRAKRYLKILKEFVGKVNATSNSSLCDVGCGYGYFLHLAQKEGFYPSLGLELVPEYVTMAGRLYGVNVSLEAPPVVALTRKFDIVTAFDVIEHVSDPNSFIESLRPLLKQDGILVVSTPYNNNLVGFFGRLVGLLFPKLFGTFLNAQGYSREHVQLFSTKSLRLLLIRNGFSVIRQIAMCDIGAPLEFYDFPFAEKGNFFHPFIATLAKVLHWLRLFPKNKQLIVANPAKEH